MLASQCADGHGKLRGQWTRCDCQEGCDVRADGGLCGWRSCRCRCMSSMEGLHRIVERCCIEALRAPAACPYGAGISCREALSPSSSWIGENIYREEICARIVSAGASVKSGTVCRSCHIKVSRSGPNGAHGRSTSSMCSTAPLLSGMELGHKGTS